MIDDTHRQILALARNAHDLTEATYQADPAVKGDLLWADKQRTLLADMALHLVQTALGDGPISQDKLKNNLYAILTISDQFLPEHQLGEVAGKLITPAGV